MPNSTSISNPDAADAETSMTSRSASDSIPLPLSEPKQLQRTLKLVAFINFFVSKK
jgi:hypothetical protein